MKKYSELVNELTEKFSDLEYLIDQLSNSMEHYDEKGFVDHMSSETNISSDGFYCKSYTIDQLIYSMNLISTVEFIKIDAEGHEESIIRGGLKLIKEQMPNLLIEIEERHNPGSINSVVKILEEMNYSHFQDPRNLKRNDERNNHESCDFHC